MKILVIDIGGSSIKVLATGQKESREEDSHDRMTPQEMVDTARRLADGWEYEGVSIGYPGMVRNGHPMKEPVNLGSGWVEFDYSAAFNLPIRIINDAAMQAMGSYEGGRMLFLGLGTGLGSVLIMDGHVVTLALGDLPFKRGTFHDYLAGDAVEILGRERWNKAVSKAARMLEKAFEADYVVIGGGKADGLKKLPPGARRGDNHNAFIGGFRLWER
jgi:predicted NBD/HSP70 family sugar kinase